VLISTYLSDKYKRHLHKREDLEKILSNKVRKHYICGTRYGWSVRDLKLVEDSPLIDFRVFISREILELSCLYL
jgi:hypothetical protein